MNIQKIGKALHLTKASWKQTIYVFLLCFIVVSLVLFKENLSSIGLIVLAAFSLFNGDLIRNFKEMLQNKYIVLFLLLFFLYVFGLIFAEDLNDGIKILTKKIPFLLVPLVLYPIGQLSAKNIKAIKFTLIFALLIGCIYCQYMTYIDWYKTNWELKKYFTYYKFSHSYLTGKIDLHPTYYSLFLITALIFLFEELKNTKHLILKISGYFLLFYFAYFIVQTASRMGFLMLVLLIFIFIHRLVKRKTIVTVGIIGVFVAFLWFQKSSITTRIAYFFEEKVTQDTEVIFSRKAAYSIFFDNFTEIPIYGLGTGNTQKFLNQKYIETGYEQYKNYNFHNAYLEVYATIGILGLLVFLACLFIPLKDAFGQKQYAFTLFLCVILVYLVFESLLFRHKGIFFFMIFTGLFLFNFQRTNYLEKSKLKNLI